MKIKLNFSQIHFLEQLMKAILWSKKETKENRLMAEDILNKLNK